MAEKNGVDRRRRPDVWPGALRNAYEETIREATSTSITHWKQLQKRVAWPHPEAQTGSHV